MTESLVQNKQDKIKKHNTVKNIAIMMGFYYLIINIILISIIQNWLIIFGFNLGCWVSFIGFILLVSSSGMLVSKTAIKQMMVFVAIIIRMIIYGTIVSLVIFFSFANLLSLIAGLSMLMIATITSELWVFFLDGYKNWRKRAQHVSSNSHN